MATFEKDFLDYIRADSSVVTLVSGGVHPTRRPQGDAYPIATVTRISGAPEYADDGEAGIEFARFQVDVYALNYGQAKDGAAAIKARLSGIQEVTQGDTVFLSVLVDEEREFDESGANQDEYIYRVSVDFTTWTQAA